jgi:hypothetical protein
MVLDGYRQGEAGPQLDTHSTHLMQSIGCLVMKN